MRPVRLVLLTALLVVCVGACGWAVTKAREAAARHQRMNSIKVIGIAYHEYLVENGGKAPQQAADLQQYAKIVAHDVDDPQASALLNGPSFVFIYGVTLKDMEKQQGASQMVLGYDKSAETDKGIVLMGDVSTQYVAADEFKKMPKAAPAPK